MHQHASNTVTVYITHTTQGQLSPLSLAGYYNSIAMTAYGCTVTRVSMPLAYSLLILHTQLSHLSLAGYYNSVAMTAYGCTVTRVSMPLAYSLLKLHTQLSSLPLLVTTAV